MVNAIRESAAPSGIADTPAGPVRWGKVTIDGGDSTFVIAVFTALTGATGESTRSYAVVAATVAARSASIAW